MPECTKCKTPIRGESGVKCEGVCEKVFHCANKCSGLDQYSSGILNTNPMIRFICGDCVLYIQNVDLVLKDVQEIVQKNGNHLKEYKNEFEESLKKNEIEIKNLLEAIESRYMDRLRAMKVAQETCENSVKEIKKMSEVGELFKAQSEKICNDVKRFASDNHSVISSVKEMKHEIVKELKNNDNKSVNNSQNEKVSYAAQVKKGPQVILKPKCTQTSTITKEDIKKQIKPSSLSINVNGLSNRKDGAIAIKCGNEEASEKIQAVFKEKKMSEQYDIQIQQMRNPKVLVCGMNEKLEKKEIESAIKAQNVHINFKSLKCVKMYESPKNKGVFNAILEVDGDALKIMLDIKKINIGWDKCVIYEELNVKRCFNCWGFNHSAKVCTNKMACSKCGGEHRKIDCVSESVKCVSCMRSKEHLQLQNVDIDHDTRSENCPVLKRKLLLEKQRILY